MAQKHFGYLLISAAVFVLIAGCVVAQPLPMVKLSEPSRDLVIDSFFAAEHFAPPKWEHGYLLSYDHDRSIAMAADNSGKVVLRTLISPDGASQVDLHDLSVSQDGTFAVAFSGISSGGGPSGFIAWLDRTGSTARLVQISSGTPYLISFADDGSLWAAVRMYGENREEAATYNILRHYGLNGKLIGSALPRKIFPPGQFPGHHGSLAVSHDRIGFLSSAARKWVELDYTGKDLGHWTLPGPNPKYSWAFVSQSDEVYIGQQERIDKSDVLRSYLFDKSSNALQQLDTSAIHGSGPASLAGVDGDDLVYLVSYHPRLLKWSTYPRSGATPAK